MSGTEWFNQHCEEVGRKLSWIFKNQVIISEDKYNPLHQIVTLNKEYKSGNAMMRKFLKGINVILYPTGITNEYRIRSYQVTWIAEAMEKL